MMNNNPDSTYDNDVLNGMQVCPLCDKAIESGCTVYGLYKVHTYCLVHAESCDLRMLKIKS